MYKYLLNSMPARIAAFAFAGALALGAMSAQASTLTPAPLDCQAGGVTLTPATYDSCDGAFLGNDSELDFEDHINTVFGTTGIWSQLAKAEENNSWMQNGLSVTLNALTGGRTGTFSITGLPLTAVFVVKAANCFSAYYFTGIGSPTSGTFDTEAAGLLTGSGCDGRNSPGLSHLTVYTSDASPIPLPAGGLLLLTALAGAGVALRRRKTA